MFDIVFYLFPQYNYTCGVKLDVRIFCYISVVLTGHLFENLHVFCFFKLLFILTFTIIKEENGTSLQEYIITTWKILIFKNSNVADGYPCYLQKLKDFENY